MSNATRSPDNLLYKFGNSAEQTLQCRIHEIEPLLLLEGTFYMSDALQRLKASTIESGEQHVRDLFTVLKKTGAIYRVRIDRSGKDPRHVWRWDDDAKAKLRKYAATMDRLPCGHRPHIPPNASANSDTAACKFCGESHPTDLYKRLLDA